MSNVFLGAALAQLVGAFTAHAEGRCSNPSRDRPKSLKQIGTVPLLNSPQPARVSRVVGDDHYKRMYLVAEGVAR